MTEPFYVYETADRYCSRGSCIQCSFGNICGTKEFTVYFNLRRLSEAAAKCRLKKHHLTKHLTKQETLKA